MIQGPPAVLAGEAPAAELAAFAVPALVLQQLSLLSRSTSLGFLPFASGESVEDDRSHLAAVFLSNTRLTLLVMCPVASSWPRLREPLLTAWIGRDFAHQAAEPMQLLAAAVVLLAISGPAADVVRGLGKPGWALVYTLVAAAIGIVVSFIAVGSLGAAGAALALLVAVGTATPPFVAATSISLLRMPAGSVLRALSGPLVSAAIVTGLFLAIAGSGSALSIAALATALVGLGFALTVYSWVLTPLERSTLKAGLTTLKGLAPAFGRSQSWPVLRRGDEHLPPRQRPLRDVA